MEGGGGETYGEVHHADLGCLGDVLALGDFGVGVELSRLVSIMLHHTCTSTSVSRIRNEQMKGRQGEGRRTLSCSSFDGPVLISRVFW